MDRAAIESALRQSGCTRITEHRDSPGTVYPPQHHPWDVVLVVLDGSLELNIGQRTTAAGVGDHLFIHAGRRHQLTIGPNGAVYLQAEKPTTHAKHTPKHL